MRPLPRVHAFTDGDILRDPDFGIHAAAIAAGGPGVALHARARGESTALLTALTLRLLALARPPEAAVLVSGRCDLAAAVCAAGVQLANDDLAPADARQNSAAWLDRPLSSPLRRGQGSSAGRV